MHGSGCLGANAWQAGQMDQRTEILILENRMCENKKGLTTGWMLPYLMWTDTNDFEAKFRLVRI